jgi:hypothetical protein
MAQEHERMRVLISYFDQNSSFERAFPESGIVGDVVESLRFRGWANDWALVELEQPFQYMGREHSRLVIASRWEGYAVGGAEPTSVFILLPPADGIADRTKLDPAKFEHVAWGMSKTLS